MGFGEWELVVLTTWRNVDVTFPHLVLCLARIAQWLGFLNLINENMCVKIRRKWFLVHIFLPFFFFFFFYIFILQFLVLKLINVWHLNSYRHLINKKSWHDWQHIKIIIKKSILILKNTISASKFKKINLLILIK